MAFEGYQIFKYLKSEGLSLVVLREGQPPIFWKGNQKVEGPFGVLTAELMRMHAVFPLSPAQAAEFSKRNFI
ncbi:hypothetical protein NL317_32325, partial [Klebsiella pneumoniae]|nr:hypothetical protein [Klebsiella pneumoniae]